jgi:hypothetical protein
MGRAAGDKILRRKNMKLFMSDGKKFNINKPRPTALKAQDFLDKSKDGELFTTLQLGAALGVNHGTLKQGDIRATIESYSHLMNRQRYWGKPSTIRQLIKETR